MSFKVFGDSAIIDSKSPIALTLGNFDGVHFGHCAMLRELRTWAGDLPVCVITFFPHPTRVFMADSPKQMLLDIETRVKKLLGAGVDAVVVQKFDEEFAELTANEFLYDYLDRHFRIQKILIGYDFSYGKDRMGNDLHLQENAAALGWEMRKGSVFERDGKPVSSSLIRQCVVKGKVKEAERLLGYPFPLHGQVVHGDKRGRTIGFPTANLNVGAEILPRFGVYACYVERQRNAHLYPAVMNCGFRPTLGQDLRLQIEAHLLDFSGDLYDEFLTFHLKDFVRDEMKFAGLDQLKAQIKKDCRSAEELLRMGGA